MYPADMHFAYHFTIFCVLSHIYLEKINGDKEYYRAAVLEHRRFGTMSDAKEDIVRKNLKVFETATRAASKNGADIIVFPEWGLYLHDRKNRTWTSNFAEDIPDPKRTFSNPCIQNKHQYNRPLLTNLSCLAKENRIYLVANLADIKRCSKDVQNMQCDAVNDESCSQDIDDCPEDGMLLYNTNVVFNREGTLIARYYKRNIFLEFHTNIPKRSAESIFFQTDFGKFTTFVCFDIFFNDSLAAVQNPDVVNVAYPTAWFDHAPFLFFGVSFHQAWAMAHKVNLLGANGHKPGMGIAGSGIYSPKGALIYTHDPDGKSKLLISNVPKSLIKSKEHESLRTKKLVITEDSAVETIGEETGLFLDNDCQVNAIGLPKNYYTDFRCMLWNQTNFMFKKITKPKGSINFCTGSYCCDLTYEIEGKKVVEDYFFGVVLNTLYMHNVWTFGAEGCFLTRCNSLGSQKCQNYVLKSRTVFHHINIKGNFSTQHILPYALDSNIRLTDRKQWELTDNSEIIYKNLMKNASLLFLGLFGRRYEKDEVDRSVWVPGLTRKLISE